MEKTLMQLYSGVPNAVPISNAGKGRPLIIEMEKNDKKKERAKEKKLKNSIANAEKKRAARAAADAVAETKGKTDVKGKEGKKGKNNIGHCCCLVGLTTGQRDSVCVCFLLVLSFCCYAP